MANDKSRIAQRDAIHSTIWGIANDLRGQVEGWDFKIYVMTFFLYRFMSEDIADFINTEEKNATGNDIDYATMDDEAAEYARDAVVQEKGYFILPSQLFCNVAQRADEDENLNETMNDIFRSIEQSSIGSPYENDFNGLLSEVDFNSRNLGSTVAYRNQRIRQMFRRLGTLDIGASLYDSKVDAFGDVYEFLMRMYAANGGKSGGEYYTPPEVANLLVRLATNKHDKVKKVYDPACGSGSLLLQTVKVLGKDKSKEIRFYGQEKNISTYNIARMNMILHGIACDHFDIRCENTLLHPQHDDDAPFDVIVSNPPYSISWDGNEYNPDKDPVIRNDPRFAPAGVLAPKSKADFAFTMHMLSYLSENGTAAIVEFPGILYRTGREQKIRKYLIDNNYIDTIISLPENLFFGPTIQTCILVLKKNKKDDKVLFVDADDLFVHDGNKNKLSDENITSIMDVIDKRTDLEHRSALVSHDDIANKDYTLTASWYVEKDTGEDDIDIEELEAQIAETVAREDELRKKIDEISARFKQLSLANGSDDRKDE